MRRIPKFAIALALLAPSFTQDVQSQEATETKTIYWSDGDSGRINGIRFRLANVDAPETDGIGARGGAKCENERKLGYEAKQFVVNFTRDKTLKIASNYGYDRYERLVIDLQANGIDVGTAAITSNFLAPWPHKGRKALSQKPDWCKMDSRREN
ncbi:MAG: hypothetical protein COA43_07950 [Robiginitomaculum sp.]|nr:MAG: hypothetical protein COA43_07950 [Robiginitomaculum sp.]